MLSPVTARPTKEEKYVAIAEFGADAEGKGFSASRRSYLEGDRGFLPDRPVAEAEESGFQAARTVRRPEESGF